MNKRNWLMHPVFDVVTVLYFLWGFSTLGYEKTWGDFFYPEDRYFENVGAISLFAASFIMAYAFWLAWKSRKTLNLNWVKLLVYLGLAALFFFGGGEEISWGQRIFNIATPDALLKINAQGEVNVHNLAPFQDGNKLLQFETLFNIFLLVFTVILPFGSLVFKWFHNFFDKYTPIVFWGIGLLFIFDYLMAKVAKLLYVSTYSYSSFPFVQAVQEVKESNYELIFVFVARSVLFELNRHIAEKTSI